MRTLKSLIGGLLVSIISLGWVPAIGATDSVARCVASAMYTPSQLDGAGLTDPTSSADSTMLAASAADSNLSPRVVPVYFHVITDGLGTDTPQLSLEKQIDVMNLTFNGQSGSAPTPFSFTLAGTDRTDNHEWFQMKPGSTPEKEAKTTLHVGDQKTLNFYVVQTPEGNSWATFPWKYRSSKLLDGIVVDRRALPGAISARNLGHTAIHETGHWLGLFHTFQGWSPSTDTSAGTSGCAEGDQVEDTPAEDSPSTDCAVVRDTCAAPGTDPVHNFMDYSLDACTNQFTSGQVVRMKEQWNLYRATKSSRRG
jgi:pregnancy-associated plasma protein-A